MKHVIIFYLPDSKLLHALQVTDKEDRILRKL